MINQELNIKFKEFIVQLDTNKINNIWALQSKIFREFWKNKIMNDAYPSLTDSEIDEIILILDKNAKGSNKDTFAVARAMIAQGAWRRMFTQIKESKNLKNHLNKLFESENDAEKSNLIDEIYTINEGKKNNLTGNSGNAINCMLFAYNTSQYISVISLNDRIRIIKHYISNYEHNLETESQGKKIIKTNNIIIEEFEKLGITCSPVILSWFLYRGLKDDWKKNDLVEEEYLISQEETIIKDNSSFYMEKELENFLIKNWDKTELGKQYDLIEEKGELVSQQYQTDIGIIDILVEDKKTKHLVVIELKRGQTSDDTVGQILRYMGWLEENKTNGKTVKGIIIASNYDKKLYYALKKTKDISVYAYKINFTLTDFKE